MSSRRRRAAAHVLEGVLVVATLGVGWLAWSLVVWRRGQTPAKQLLRMRCIDTWTGRAAGFRTMARREAADKWLPTVATLGLWMFAGGMLVLGERRECAWDKTAGAIVIDDPDGRYAPARWHDRRHARRRPADAHGPRAGAAGARRPGRAGLGRPRDRRRDRHLQPCAH
jgi:hypothetical protein